MSYERMLDKSITPTFEDMKKYIGERGELWEAFMRRMSEICPIQATIRFPYGNNYGWSVRYGLKDKADKHVCDAFAENGAFTVHFRVSSTQIEKVYDMLSDYSRAICDNKYPCGDGGWLSYRVLTDDNLEDVIKIITSKLNK